MCLSVALSSHLALQELVCVQIGNWTKLPFCRFPSQLVQDYSFESGSMRRPRGNSAATWAHQQSLASTVQLEMSGPDFATLCSAQPEHMYQAIV